MVAAVSFDGTAGRCGRKVIENLRQELAWNSIESKLDAWLETEGGANGRLAVPSAYDSAAAGNGDGTRPSRMGRNVGVDIEDRRCGFDRERSTSTRERTRKKKKEVDGEEVEVTEKYTETVYRSMVSLDAALSVEFEDLATGESLGRRQLSYRPDASSTSTSGYPDYASEEGLLKAMASRASDELSKVLSPWTERKSVLFYDAEECDMGVAHSHLESGNLDRALELSLSNLARCANDPDMDDEYRAAAYYNVGVVRFMREEHAAAIEVLDEAMLLDADNAEIASLRSDAVRARGLMAEIERIKRGAR